VSPWEGALWVAAVRTSEVGDPDRRIYDRADRGERSLRVKTRNASLRGIDRTCDNRLSI
ncbi:unnamed protein product, partial [Bubo scandiacus]